ncbi:uncharacterized protein LOC108051534 [Drosophila rhopaloa]|uniref:Uncharacterized protein n=1 Tax=Drosophila rhopaloa TaxID=1041015 RepID=A0ABM5I2Q6_DRORH|nr:uncharacterized protein LOC108051534 [Drosophila rhopaloa]
MKEKKKSRGVLPPGPDPPGSSNVVNSEDFQSETDDRTHEVGDQGAPFILVDCMALKDLIDLDATLCQVERNRMEKVEDEIGGNYGIPLEDVTPPPELDMPINLSSKELARLKAAEDERRFNEDMRNLTISRTEEDEEVTSDTTEHKVNSISDVALNESKLLLQTTSNLEQIRSKLEQLRDLQEQILLADSVPEVVAASSVLERPSIRRQGTFDIKRDGDKNVDYPDIAPEASEAKTQSQSRTLPITRRARIRAKITSSGTISRSERSKSVDGQKVTSENEQIISQIGDLLMKLQLHHEQGSVLDEGSSYSFMVTIKPAGGASNCSVHAITDLKSRERKTSVQPQDFQSPSINIFSPANGTEVAELSLSSRCVNGNSFLPISVPETSSMRVKSPYLRKRPCSYLKVPAPARYCHGRKRD